MSNPSHSDIMRKLKEIKGIKELLEKAVLLYVLLTDGDLPVWCYALIIGALAYLVNPFDAVCSGLMNPDTILGGTVTTLDEVFNDQKTSFLFC